MMEKNQELQKGKIQHIHIWGNKRVLGDIEVVRETLVKLVEAIGMTPYGDTVVREYPTPDGFGGDGFTATACVAVQHLHESYIVYDSWVEYDPAYANIVINSCRHFDIKAAEHVVNLHLNPCSIRVSKPDFYSQDRWDNEVGDRT